MKHVKSIQFLLACSILIISSLSQAAIITVTGMPEDYTIHRWDYTAEQTTSTAIRTADIQTYNFNIPDNLIIQDDSGKINLYETLQNWARSTPAGPQYPKTVNGITRFPFTVPDSPSNPYPRTQSMYLAIGEMIEDSDATTNLNLSSSDGRAIDITVPVTSLEAVLESFRGKTVNCESRSGNPAICLLCNCANEAGGNNEPHAGRVAAGQTVLTRVVRKGYPSTICGVVWSQNRSGTAAAFAWTLGGNLRSRDNVSGNDMNQCIDASVEAIRKGPWAWDMFYSGGRPSWYSDFIHRGTETIGGHTFMNSGAGRKDGADNILDEELSVGGQNGVN